MNTAASPTETGTAPIHGNADDTTVFDNLAAHWLLRLSLAATFIFHGIGKFGNLAAGAEKFGVSLGIWTLVAVIEVVAPLVLIVGGFVRSRFGDLLTRLGAAAMVPILLGAIALVHWGQWSFAASETHPAGGMEFQVALLAMSVYLALRGNNA